MSQKLPDPSNWLADLIMSQTKILWPEHGADAKAPTSAAWSGAMNAFAQWQQDTLRVLAAPWAGSWPGLQTALEPSTDKRFAGAAWSQDPRYEAVARTYLTQTDLLRKALDAAPLDERSKAQWGFALGQVMDALSPANMLATNPEAIQLALESGGASLTRGCASTRRTSRAVGSR